jgi:hypothetical protein
VEHIFCSNHFLIFRVDLGLTLLILIYGKSAAMADPVPTLKLNNGVAMPALGFGTYASDKQDGETFAAVTSALEAGYRHLDCAW